jgi:preprotein translocase subunit YajC
LLSTKVALPAARRVLLPKESVTVIRAIAASTFSIFFLSSSALASFPLAQGQPAQPAPSGGGGLEGFFSNPIYLFIPLIIVWFFLLSGGKRKEERKRKELLSQIKRGERVQTIGGIIGKVVDTEDTKILVKVDESSNTKIWFSRDAIFKVLGEEKAAEASEKK